MLLKDLLTYLLTHRLSTATYSHFHLAHVKSGQIRDAKPKSGQIGVPGDLWFFPGLEVKNRDCPRKSGLGWSP